MAHYAIIDPNTMLVTQVFVGKDETDETQDWEQYYAPEGTICRRTSYHGNIRAHYAGIGYTYDDQADVFYAPQPYPSWALDNEWNWQPPTPYPDDDNPYVWNEDTLTWVEVEQ
jgi:hypothetical protein